MKRTPSILVITPIALLLTCLVTAVPASAWTDDPGDGEGRVVVLKKVQEKLVDGNDHELLFSGLSSAYLGVELVELTPELRIHFGVPDDRGVMIGRVEEESPAATAGLAVGDVITEIDGEAVESGWDLSLAVRQHEPGDEVDLELWRDGQALQFSATVGERERERIELGHLMRDGELAPPPKMFWTQKQLEGKDPSTIVIRPQVIEELGENLRTIDWEEVGEKMRSRNEVLEERIQQLEKRLQQLEARLEDGKK